LMNNYFISVNIYSDSNKSGQKLVLLGCGY